MLLSACHAWHTHGELSLSASCLVLQHLFSTIKQIIMKADKWQRLMAACGCVKLFRVRSPVLWAIVFVITWRRHTP